MHHSQIVHGYRLVLCLALVSALVNHVRLFILGWGNCITPQFIGELFYVSKCQKSPLSYDVLGPIPYVEQWHSDNLVGPGVLNLLFF